MQSLMSQDMYLAGAFVLLICALTLVGTLISDVLLALVDPDVVTGRTIGHLQVLDGSFRPFGVD